MATCITKARSNYFSVTDVPAFLTMMQKWEKDFGIRIMKKRIDEDQTVYAFSSLIRPFNSISTTI